MSARIQFIHQREFCNGSCETMAGCDCARPQWFRPPDPEPATDSERADHELDSLLDESIAPKRPPIAPSRAACMACRLLTLSIVIVAATAAVAVFA